MAQKMFTKIPVHTVDSGSASWGQALIAIAAARAANQGKEVDEIIHLIEVIKERMNVFFVLDTLEYLYRGGRIGGAAAFFGSSAAYQTNSLS
jgi:DegV family protein with EDD domain